MLRWAGEMVKEAHDHPLAQKSAVEYSPSVTSLNPTLLNELQTATEPVQREVLDFLLFIKRRHGTSPAGIERTAGVCGGDACIAGTRIPVWSLEQARRLGFTEEQLLENYPALRRGDLEAAWGYVAAHTSEIDETIRLNEED